MIQNKDLFNFPFDKKLKNHFHRHRHQFGHLWGRAIILGEYIIENKQRLHSTKRKWQNAIFKRRRFLKSYAQRVFKARFRTKFTTTLCNKTGEQIHRQSTEGAIKLKKYNCNF